MNKIFRVLSRLLKIAGESSEKIDWAVTTLVGAICLVAESVRNPQGAINTLFIHFVDVLIVVWPSTPSQFKLASLIGNVRSDFPGFQWVIVQETVIGLGGILAFALIVKFRKL